MMDNRGADGSCVRGSRASGGNNGAVKTARTLMNVSPDSTSIKNIIAGFVFKNVIAGVMLNESDYPQRGGG